GNPRPASLHAFRELRSGPRLAPSTAGDLLFHIRAERVDLCYGSYVMVQKYLHDHARWYALPTEIQEHIIGRTKADDVELDAAHKLPFAHNELTTLIENGVEVKILRHNMPFGKVASGESGTYFIGYARSLEPLETMLRNMVIGRPTGNYDRLLDYTAPVTGT